jgi:hypothetical protein
LVADPVGESLHGGAEAVNFGGEAGERAGVVAAVSVFFDDGTKFGIAVEGCPADPGAFGDGGERDLLAGSGEFAADGFDDVWGWSAANPFYAH